MISFFFNFLVIKKFRLINAVPKSHGFISQVELFFQMISSFPKNFFLNN